MNRNDALNYVARAAQPVRAITACDRVDDYDAHLKLYVAAGRTIKVRYCDDWQGNRLVIRAGMIGVGRWRKEMTRTFRQKKDGTFNEAGITAALAKMAEAQIQDVIAQEREDQRRDDERSAVERTKHKLRDVLQRHRWVDDDTPEHLALSTFGNVEAEGLDVDVQVRGTGSVELKLTGLSAEQALITLRRLGWTNDPVTTERTAC